MQRLEVTSIQRHSIDVMVHVSGLLPAFLFSILDMGTGPSEMGKKGVKTGNWEKSHMLKSLKILKPGHKTLQTVILFPWGSWVSEKTTHTRKL